MNIGEVSNYLKITKKAINIYEEKGLICPEKDCNGYRIYNDNEIAILRQIKILRSLDFSIAEIKELILNKDYKVFNQKLEDLKIKEYELQKKIQYLDLVKNDFIENIITKKIDDYQELLDQETKEEIRNKSLYVDFEDIFLNILLFLNIITMTYMNIINIIPDLVVIILIPIWLSCIALIKYPQARNYFYQLYKKLKKYQGKHK